MEHLVQSQHHIGQEVAAWHPIWTGGQDGFQVVVVGSNISSAWPVEHRVQADDAATFPFPRLDHLVHCHE